MNPPHFRTLLRSKGWLLVLVTATSAVFMFLLIFGALRPAPPTVVTMLTGAEGGAYQFFADRYRQAFAAVGIELRLLTTSGAVENLRRIKTDSAVDLALIQAGLANEPDSEDLVQLGSVFAEPLWIFQRSDARADHLTSLADSRIAIGVPESGTQLLTLQLLAASGFDISSERLVAVGGNQAAGMLRSGEVDAAFFVANARAPAVQSLLADPLVQPFDLALADAYQRRFRHLDVLSLPAGTLDLENPRPAHDLRMLGTSAVLVARRELHPAVVSLLLQTARSVNGGADLFQTRGEYPSVRDGGLPLSPQAQRFYESGPPFLQRYLPFWLAVLLDRVLVALVPVLALLIPLSRIAPPIYAWRMRSRIYRWYGELKFLENELKSGSSQDFDNLLQRLDRIEDAANAKRIPLAYSNELYTLREHILLVRRQAIERRDQFDRQKD